MAIENRIVPTHVGVNRQGGTETRGQDHRPHARGGEPKCVATGLPSIQSSPRTWGVNRSGARTVQARNNRPHARGGEPVADAGSTLAIESSPRTWG